MSGATARTTIPESMCNVMAGSDPVLQQAVFSSQWSLLGWLRGGPPPHLCRLGGNLPDDALTIGRATRNRTGAKRADIRRGDVGDRPAAG
jgi:hypothetical protein